MHKTLRCPDCGGDVVADIDGLSGHVLDYAHVTPACPMFAQWTYDENVERLRPSQGQRMGSGRSGIGRF